MSRSPDLAGSFSGRAGSQVSPTGRNRPEQVRARTPRRSATKTAAVIVMAILDAEGCKDFPRAVCRAVYENIPAHRVSMGSLHRRLGRFRAAYWPPMPLDVERELLARFGTHFTQHPRFQLPVSRNHRHAVASWADLDPQRRFLNTQLYREFYAPEGITDQLTVTLAGPDQIALGLTIDRAGGCFTESEKEVLQVVQHALDAVFGRLDHSRLRDVLCSIGWTRITADPNGDVVDYDAPDGRPLLTSGESLTSMPWWRDVAPALDEDPLLNGSTEPEIQTISSGETTVLVERPMLGRPVLYLLEGVPTPAPDQAADCLTLRQAEVARLLVDGRSAREIAAHLHISLATARSHIEHVYRRLGVSNRAQAVAVLLGSSANYRPDR